MIVDLRKTVSGERKPASVGNRHKYISTVYKYLYVVH